MKRPLVVALDASLVVLTLTVVAVLVLVLWLALSRPLNRIEHRMIDGRECLVVENRLSGNVRDVECP